MTKAHHNVYTALERLKCRGYDPTVDEIRAEAGLRSIATAHKHLMALVRDGAITRIAHRGGRICEYKLHRIKRPGRLRLDQVLGIPDVRFIRMGNWPAGMTISAQGHFSAHEVQALGWEVADGPVAGTANTD